MQTTKQIVTCKRTVKESGQVIRNRISTKNILLQTITRRPCLPTYKFGRHPHKRVVSYLAHRRAHTQTLRYVKKSSCSANRLKHPFLSLLIQTYYCQLVRVFLFRRNTSRFCAVYRCINTQCYAYSTL